MILGLDISTTCVGIALFTDEGKTVELNYIKFPSKPKLTKFEKLKYFIEATKYFDNLPEKINFIAIEEPLKKFAGKFSSADTIATLNIFNGMVSAHVYLKYGVQPIYFNAAHARKEVFPNVKLPKENKKAALWKLTMEMEPLVQWKYGTKSRKLLPENYDSVDAYVTGCALILLLDKQRKGLPVSTGVDDSEESVGNNDEE